MKMPIYFDYHATTPMDPKVLQAMTPYFTQLFGNPASASHAYGWQAEAAVAKARNQVAELIGAKEKEIIFTSGATESNNLGILGAIGKVNGHVPHLIVTQVEHSCVLAVAKELESRGIDITYLSVNKYGQVELETLKAHVKPTTTLISTIFANNEIGSINPVKEIGQFCRSKGIIYHVDAAQAVGKIPMNINDLNVDLLSLSGHKIYGPKGIGALFVHSKNPRIRLDPVIFGGGQERGIRPGTLNVPAIVGLGASCEIALQELPTEAPRLQKLRDKLEAAIKSELKDVFINGHPSQRLGINLNVSFAGCLPDFLMENLSPIAVSTGSACASASMKASHVLSAIGVHEDLARSTIRFGVGRFTTDADIDIAITTVLNAVNKCRKIRVGGKHDSPN